MNNIRGMKIRCKSKTVLNDCIGLHGLMKNNDIPSSCKNRVPKDELWIREDHCDHNELKEGNIILHEDVELLLMKEYGFTYRVAHNFATNIEHKWLYYKMNQ